jgi:hypothetical protein
MIAVMRPMCVPPVVPARQTSSSVAATSRWFLPRVHDRAFARTVEAPC